MSPTPETTQDVAYGFLPGDTEAECSSRQARDQEGRNHPQERCGSPAPTPGSMLPRSELTQLPIHSPKPNPSHALRSVTICSQAGSRGPVDSTRLLSVSNGRPRLLLVPTDLHWRLESPPATEAWLLNPSLIVTHRHKESQSGTLSPNCSWNCHLTIYRLALKDNQVTKNKSHAPFYRHFLISTVHASALTSATDTMGILYK